MNAHHPGGTHLGRIEDGQKGGAVWVDDGAGGEAEPLRHVASVGPALELATIP